MKRASAQRWRRQGRVGQSTVWFHLAGGFEPGTIEETPLDRWNRQLALNTTAAFLVSRAVIPHLSRGGRILMISSALTQHVTRGAGAYAVSKAALNTLVDVLAVELKDRQITVNAILPTTLDTPANRTGGDAAKLIPLDRVAGTHCLPSLRRGVAHHRLAARSLTLISAGAYSAREASPVVHDLLQLRGR